MKKFTIAMIASLVFPVAAQAASLVHAFEFNGSAVDSVGSATANINGSTQGATTLSVPDNGGPTITLPAALVSFAIEMRVKIDDTGNWVKLIDFQDRSSDSGFYNFSTQARFHLPSIGTPSGTFTSGQFSTVVFNRNGVTKALAAYVDGVLAFSFTDVTDAAAAGTVFHFFRDDLLFGSPDSDSGELDYVRFYDAALSPTEIAALSAVPVPAPAALPLLAGALGLLGLARCRRS